MEQRDGVSPVAGCVTNASPSVLGTDNEASESAREQNGASGSKKEALGGSEHATVEGREQTKSKKQKKRKARKQKLGPGASPDPKQDIIISALVQATNDSSIKSKGSMARLGYVDDRYGRMFVRKPSRRSPLINRGYYVRTAAMRHVIERFLEAAKHSPSLQILSLGAGFDTSLLRMFELKKLRDNDRVFEVDFEQVMVRKRAVLEQDESLAALLTAQGDAQHARISLLGCDMSNGDKLTKKLLEAGMHRDAPTLVMSECVLTYMEPVPSSSVLQWCSSFLSRGWLLLYEQTIPDDAFGQVMTKHFKKIGSPLRCISTFRTFHSYHERLEHAGWQNVQVTDMARFFYHVLSDEERARINSIEFFDEYEEWHQKCQHYFLAVAQCGAPITGVADDRAPLTRLERPEYTGEHVVEHPTRPLGGDAQWYEVRCPLAQAASKLRRWGHVSRLVGKFVYVHGGYGGEKHAWLDDLWRVSATTGSVEEVVTCGSAPEARAFHVSARWRDHVMIVHGGRTGPKNIRKDIWGLDTGSLQWRCITADAPPRWRHAAVVRDDSLVIVAGMERRCSLAPVGPVVYNLCTGELKPVEVSEGPVPVKRHSHAMVKMSDGTVILMGGLDEHDAILSDVWSLQIVDGVAHWRELGDVGGEFARYSHELVEDCEMGLICCGGVGRQALYWQDMFFVVNLTQETCAAQRLSVDKPQKEPWLMTKHTAHCVDGRLVVIGGGGNCFSFGSHYNPFAMVLANDPPTASDSTESSTACNGDIGTQRMDSGSISGFFQSDASMRPPTVQVTRMHARDVSEQFSSVIGREWRVPVVFEGLNFGESVRKWTAAYLASKLQGKLVSAHVCDEERFSFVHRNFQFEVMPFEELIGHTLTQDDSRELPRYYLRSIGSNARRDVADIRESFPEIAQDFRLPPAVEDIALGERFFSSVLRIGSRNMRLWTHYDMMDNVLCQVSGEKHVVLFPPSDVARMYLHGSSSEVLDIDTPDPSRYALFLGAQRYEVTLRPGDMLFIPAMWFHNVHSITASTSVNVFWRHLERDMYQRKDLFGNKDLPVAESALSAIDGAVKQLRSLPAEYRSFYARRAIQHLSQIAGEGYTAQDSDTQWQ